MVLPIETSRFEQLKASGDLPSPKGTALAVMRMTLLEDVSMAELAQLIRTDPAFVGRLIKAANGIIGYGRRPIVSVQDALTVLGLPAVRNMALGFSLLGNYQTGACDGFDYGAYWSSSLLIAVATQAVTLRTRVAAPDETYCLGLLTRVGELAMATLYPHDYSLLLCEAGGDLRALLELEARSFAMTHAELGAAMLADWGLPKLFCDVTFCVARGEENPHAEGSREAVLAVTLQLARSISDLCLADVDARPAFARQVQLVGSRLSFDAEECASLTDAVTREWHEWGALLNVHTGQLPPFSEMIQPTPLAVTPMEEQMSEAGGIRLLMVGSDQTHADHVREVLAGACRMIVVPDSDYAKATELALELLPELVMLPWQADAAGFVQTLRKTRVGKTMFVLAYAESLDEGMMAVAFDAGVDDVLAWPLNPRVLYAKLRTGHRLGFLQQEIRRDREEIRHFAAELVVSHRRLQEASSSDALTGLPNRLAFVESLSREWEFAHQAKHPLSAILIDIDRFHVFNKTYGSKAGDSVLRQLASIVHAALRSQDFLARTGEDELSVLCPGTTLEAAVACAQRVRSAIAGARFAAGGLNLALSASIGVACRSKVVTDVDSLIKLVELGVSRSRLEGGGRVCAIQLRPDGIQASA
ncbi:MAG: diguanylate cyclase response regulator [Candidatus Dactylopiibacterium carminicum]|uniref:diguanylate cyclase n=1 Tax=Candidatus Dactylopiibacterium carminicum TaxID=857335 RepID=A0A272EMR5_9RHOO|nr:HDOD domain-containing protein [Candidatus Dactylopiibacterium carminicum]KAF7597794.1 diguanylate cyclase response regulator [Candidatus Dactylopiibacterium carminicum]PAS91382.1 MAG: diguanylate cyclase response regulator [Candidatus Dactylopiibacterium carminicum]PAS95556.1 MAG: hypothetical protein BSR46_16865 [Candidatus Dactylopiibacterium carminicum]